jgi:outer membrane protein OmpA-like peptidoglycan-associated protein
MRNIILLLIVGFTANAQTFSVYFETDKSVIQPLYIATLDSAAQLAAKSRSNLLIACHCDSRADSAYNYHLSLRRAESVKTYLLKKGAVARIELVGFGESKPDYPNTEMQRYKNRRCDVRLASAQEHVATRETKNFTETEVTKLVNGTLLTLDGLEFVGNQAVPNYYSMPVLYQVLKVMQENPELNIFLKGHVCCGDDYPLSVARAKSVYDFLIANDIDASRMEYEGYSNTLPAVKEVDDATETRNRRVELLVVNNGKAKATAEEKIKSFRVVLREINFRPNAKFPDHIGEYNLNLLAEMIASSNGYLYVLEVFSPNKNMMAQRRNYIDALMRRQGIAKKTMVIIPMRDVVNYKEDILILEVKRQTNE